MKAVLLSIQPKWCELIASGKKTIEVRKTRPNIDTPFKCYIYCTYGNALADLANCQSRNIEEDVKKGNIRRYALQEHKIKEPIYSTCAYGNGKAIGEFVCDDITEISPFVYDYYEYSCSDDFISDACLDEDDLLEYGKDKTLYGWHITDLKIYDEPKELSEFYKPLSEKDLDEGNYNCDSEIYCSACCYDEYEAIGCDECTECEHGGRKPLKRPPESWQYVEEL